MGLNLSTVLALGVLSGAISGADLVLQVPAIITGLCALSWARDGTGHPAEPGAGSQQLDRPSRGKVGPFGRADHHGRPADVSSRSGEPRTSARCSRSVVMRRRVLGRGGCRPHRVIAYALGGISAAIAGIALTGLIHSADSTLGLQYPVTAIAPCRLAARRRRRTRRPGRGVSGRHLIYLIQNLLGSRRVGSMAGRGLRRGAARRRGHSAQLRPRRRAEVPA